MFKTSLRSLYTSTECKATSILFKRYNLQLTSNTALQQRLRSSSSRSHVPQSRFYSSTRQQQQQKGSKKGWSQSNVSAGMYTASMFIAMLGMSYTAVPLYRLFCANTGFSGTPVIDSSRFGPERLVPLEDNKRKRIRVTFESNTSDTLPWTFKPEVREVYVVPGETALTFYKAKSKAKDDVIGIATYNVTPYRAASYFNKIQCFCFEEQKLKPGEDVDMPVFFFIDPDFLEDPLMKDVNTITLSYTFFNSKYAKGLTPVQPTFAK